MAVDIIARGLAGRADSKAITAYEYAKRAGYTGTEEEFAEDMGNSATNATNARESAEQAQEYAEQAEQTLENKADIDGSYEDLTAGSAEQLLSDKFVEDKVAYSFRKTAGGKAVGNRAIDEIIGGTLVVNQLLNHENAQLSNEASYNTNAHRFTVNLPENAAANNYVRFTNLPLMIGHKYFLMFKVVSISEGASFRCYFPNSSSPTAVKGAVSDKIFEYQSNFYNYLYVGKASAVTQAQSITFEVTLVDITQMFGSSSIADYVYSLETTTAGNGVTWLYEYFPILNGGYIPYGTGSFQSIMLSKHKMTEFNQYNPNAEKYRLGAYSVMNMKIGKTNKLYMTLQDKDTSIDVSDISFGFLALDATFPLTNDKYNWVLRSGTIESDHSNQASVSSPTTGTRELLDGVMIYPPEDSTWERLNARYNICISIDSERNGEYEPYNAHEYTLDSSKELRGVPKIDSNGKLYFDGDRYKTGITRNYGEYVFTGNETWTISGNYAYTNTISSMADGVLGAQAICDKPVNGLNLTSVNSQRFIIYLDFTIYDTSEKIQAYVSGMTAYYPLATPTTEEATPIPNPQICSPDGTEEYIDPRVEAGTIPFAIPTGHNTKYLQNLRQKLDDLPFAPSEYGDYLVRVSADGIAFIPFANGTQIPTIPTSADGRYDLVADVSSGTVALSWVARS